MTDSSVWHDEDVEPQTTGECSGEESLGEGVNAVHDTD